jgi:hypothetical protein
MRRLEAEYVVTPNNLPLKGKEAIIETLGKLAMPKEEYFVLGGANMVLRGIKPSTVDIDVLVSRSLFDRLHYRMGAAMKQPPASAIRRGARNLTAWLQNDNLPLPLSATTSLGDGCYPMSFESHVGRTELVDDIPCSILDDVIAAKASLQRTKDLSDLRYISNFTGEPIELTQPPIAGPLLFS